MRGALSACNELLYPVFSIRPANLGISFIINPCNSSRFHSVPNSLLDAGLRVDTYSLNRLAHEAGTNEFTLEKGFKELF